MYPDDQIVEIFGEQVMYPGLDPVTRKFTDGDFSNPLIKPSHIPAATFNLILDNMESLVRSMGLDPNNTDTEQLTKAVQRGFNSRVVGEYHSLSFEPSVDQLISWRYLPLDYRIIKIALYEELCNLMYCGDDKNDAAPFWYKCDEGGTRNINGEYMRVQDSRGLFPRNAGQNAVFKGANNTPYNGGEVGEFQPDQNLAHTHSVRGIVDNLLAYGTGTVSLPSGTFVSTGSSGGSEAKPASISRLEYISY
jgi:hypothetical protein